MKKLVLLLFITQTLFGQVSTLPYSIGIGQNTLSSIPFHVNRDGEVARFQGTNPYMSFYNGANWNGYIQAYGNILAMGTKNNFDLELYTGDIPRFTINGITGQATANQRFTAANGINLIGPLRVAGNNVGFLGDVLMSLGNGTPAWATVNFNPQIGYEVKLPSNFAVPYNSETFLVGFSESYDTNSNMNPVTGEFTVPSAGVYHFEGKFWLDKNNISDPDIVNGLFIVDLYVNNSFIDRIILDYRTSVLGGFSPHFLYQNTVKLLQNDVVKFSVKQLNEHSNQILISRTGSGNASRMNAYKIY